MKKHYPFDEYKANLEAFQIKLYRLCDELRSLLEVYDTEKVYYTKTNRHPKKTLKPLLDSLCLYLNFNHFE